MGCAALLAGACATQTPLDYPQDRIPTEPGQYPYPALPPDTVPATSPAQISGAWRTAPSASPDMEVDIDGQRIVARFGCLAQAWTYRFEGARLIVASSPIISCQRMASPYEAEQFNQVAKADRVYHRGGRGLIFRGSGSQLVLIAR